MNHEKKHKVKYLNLLYTGGELLESEKIDYYQKHNLKYEIKYDPNIPPKNLTLKDIQKEFFTENDPITNHNPKIYNDLNKLWYIYSTNVYGYPVEYYGEEYVEKITAGLNKFVKSVKSNNKDYKKIYDLYKKSFQKNNNEIIGGSDLYQNKLLMEDCKESHIWLPLINITNEDKNPSSWFCMSVPPYNNIDCFRKLSLLALKNNITKLICLEQDILEIEEDSWYFLDKLKNNKPTSFSFVKMVIPDYESGSFKIYDDFFEEAVKNCNTRTCIHCLAGFGRTASMVLFYILIDKYYMHMNDELNSYNPSIYHEMDYYRYLMNKCVGNDNQNKEFFDTDNNNKANLLMRRLNSINLFLTIKNNLENVCLYKLTNISTGFYNNNLTEHDIIAIQNVNINDLVPHYFISQDIDFYNP